MAGINPGGNLTPLAIDVAGNLLVAATSLPLPTGAATAAKQDVGNTSLASIDTHATSIDSKTPALGQALAAASVPVVLTAAQLTTLTPLSTVTVVQPTGTNLHVVVDSSGLPSGAATEATLSALNSKVTAVNTGAVVVSSSALPTGASTSSLQTTGNTSLSSIDTKLSSQATAANQTSLNALVTARLSGALVPAAYDEIDLTYVTVGNGIGQIQTAVYKLAASTVKTLTLSYDSSDRISSVVAS